VGIGLAIATSGSRAGLVTVFVSVASFGLIAAVSRNAIRVAGGLVVAFALVFVIFQQLGPDNSTTQRGRSIAPSKILSSYSEERGSSLARFGDYATQYPLGLGVGVVGPASSFRSSSADRLQALNSENQWNFLVLETGLAGLAIILALNLRIMFLALARIRTVAKTATRLDLAALSAPLFGLVTLGFAGPTTVAVPAAPYFWLVAGALSYWLITARGLSDEVAGAHVEYERPQKSHRLARPAHPERAPALP
jgi:O-antigen ligase